MAWRENGCTVISDQIEEGKNGRRYWWGEEMGKANMETFLGVGMFCSLIWEVITWVCLCVCVCTYICSNWCVYFSVHLLHLNKKFFWKMSGLWAWQKGAFFSWRKEKTSQIIATIYRASSCNQAFYTISNTDLNLKGLIFKWGSLLRG